GTRQRRQRQPPRRCPAAVHAGSCGGGVAVVGEPLGDQPLQRAAGVEVAGGVVAAEGLGQQEGGVLAGAVVRQRRRHPLVQQRRHVARQRRRAAQRGLVEVGQGQD